MSRFPMNLQLFAEGAEGPEPADPGTLEGAVIDEGAAGIVVDPEKLENDDPAEGAEEPELADPETDRDAIFAEARRAAENRMNGINSRVASRFKDMKNPETGQPIRTVEDYFDALDAQERIAARQQMEQNGIDPALLDQMIANNPAIRQAQEILRENQLNEGQRELDSQVRAISEFYPEVQSLADISKMDTFPAFDAYVRNGLSLVDAFKLANFETMSQRTAAATKQAAINAAKGKSHLSPVGVGADGQTTQFVDIPPEAREVWEQAYPDLSYKELKEKYNKSL